MYVSGVNYNPLIYPLCQQMNSASSMRELKQSVPFLEILPRSPGFMNQKQGRCFDHGTEILILTIMFLRTLCFFFFLYSNTEFLSFAPADLLSPWPPPHTSYFLTGVHYAVLQWEWHDFSVKPKATGKICWLQIYHKISVYSYG